MLRVELIGASCSMVYPIPKKIIKIDAAGPRHGKRTLAGPPDHLGPGRQGIMTSTLFDPLFFIRFHERHYHSAGSRGL